MCTEIPVLDQTIESYLQINSKLHYAIVLTASLTAWVYVQEPLDMESITSDVGGANKVF
jgi:hypothetical protein